MLADRTVAVVGGGPAGLAAAERLATAGCAVTIYEGMPSVGRKFLMAGRGGLNLTHAEPLPAFLARYADASSWLAPAIEAFPAEALTAWCEGLGQPCFTGTSGHVFPRTMKASPLLRAWLRRLDGLGVGFRTRCRLTGLDDAGGLLLDGPDGAERVAPDATILSLGGGSWARLGSDGAWMSMLAAIEVKLAPFRPANCGFAADWSPAFLERFAGTPLKSVALHADGLSTRGDLIVTRDGIEGGAAYALAAPLRDAIARHGRATLTIDLRPDLSIEAIAARLARVRERESLSNTLRKALSLAPVAIGLLREGETPGRTPTALAARIKAVPVTLLAAAPLDRAISTAGGVMRDAIDAGFMLRDRPGVFVAGEMLDWEAPTGGYLLHACLATGRAAADGALAWLERPR